MGLSSSFRSVWYVCFLFFIAFFLSRCTTKDSQIDWDNYQPVVQSQRISTYKISRLSPDDPVVIDFISAPQHSVTNLKPHEFLKTEGFTIDNHNWTLPHQLTLYPAKLWDPGQKIQLGIHLEKLFLLEDNEPSHIYLEGFSLPMEPRFTELTMEVNEDNHSLYNIVGTIRTQFPVDISSIQQMTEVKLDERKLALKWDSLSTTTTFQFKAIDIGRSNNKEQTISANINWQTDHESVLANESLIIPPAEVFQVVRVARNQENPRHFTLIFSHNLDPAQDITGLIYWSQAVDQSRLTVKNNIVELLILTEISSDGSVVVHPGIRSKTGIHFSEMHNTPFEAFILHPELKTVSDGVIMPSVGGFLYPFRARGLRHVYLRIFEVHDNNLMQFLQVNELTDNNQLNRVGTLISSSVVDLQSINSGADFTKLHAYNLNLKNYIEAVQGRIYRIEISFARSFALLDCSGTFPVSVDLNDEIANSVNYNWDNYFGIYGYYDGYRWNHRENPCFPAFYNSERFIAGNFFSSDIGIIAKANTGGGYNFAVTNLSNARPAVNANVTLYNFQQQAISSVSTNRDGFAAIDKASDEAAFVTVQHNQELGILKLNHSAAIPLSKFDAGGKTVASGDFFMYGERGVWRPGDTIFLNVVYRMNRQEPPEGFPIELQLKNARGSHYTTLLGNHHVGGIYHFAIPTSPADPTGVWQAKFTAGLVTYTHNIRIEHVKPNRMKINMDIDGQTINVSDDLVQGNLEAQWLHGAPANSMEAVVDLNFQQHTLTYKDYVFHDPSRALPARSNIIKAGKTNAEGRAVFNIPANLLQNLPGRVKLQMQARVMEQGGDYSFANFDAVYNPYKVYTGLKLPVSSWGSTFMPVNSDGTVELISINTEGNPAPDQNLEVNIFRLSHSWWYDMSDEYLQRFTSGEGVSSIQKFTISTDRRGIAEIKTAMPNYGRYYIRACNEASGHCSGMVFFAGDRRMADDERDGVAMVALQTDKEKYKPGESAKIKFQGSDGARALISIEQGGKQLRQEWVQVSSGEQTFSLAIKPEMVPNVYVSVTLLQPYSQTGNDLPIRMFGTVPVMVEDPANVLKPVITMQDKLRPEQSYQIKVKEEKGKAMSYTLAVVDEGLLNLTNFRTPNPYENFYAKQALGVVTYDLYNRVISRLPGSLLSLLRMGGSDAVQPEAARRAMRFKPVVTHLGPFYLEPGKEAVHQIDMPAYIGAVRVMVVAANKNAYGSAEKLVEVSNPVMVLATLPRILGPGDRLSIPVTVFTDNDRAGNIEISMQEDPHFQFVNGNKVSLNMVGKREQIAYIPILVKEQEGIADVRIRASDGRNQANYQTEIQIENPAAFIRDVQIVAIQPGESITLSTPIRGNPANASVNLEISDFGSFGYEHRISELINYPHGCLEQTTSTAFPQLYADVFKTLTPDEAKEVQNNINEAIYGISRFQNAQGSFSYWPGTSTYSNWSDIFAFHFLLEAEMRGYAVSSAVKTRWINFHKAAANRWRFDASSTVGNYSTMVQAYRLLVLALADEPQFGSMNRMRQTQGLPENALWRLAAAYGAAGQQEVAASIIRSAKPYSVQERSHWNDFASPLREDALMTESYIRAGMLNATAAKIPGMMRELASTAWLSTQEAAYSMYAIALFVKAQPANKEPTQVEVVWGNENNTIKIETTDPLTVLSKKPERSGNFPVDIANNSPKVVFATLSSAGKPIRSAQAEASNELSIQINYTGADGGALNIAQLKQGAYFYATLSIKNTSRHRMDNLALEQIIPAGWEIMNPRMQPNGGNQMPVMEYQDVKDDRILSYFKSLRSGEEVKFTLQFLAAYAGNYWMPPTQVYPMYDETRFARTVGREVSILPAPKNNPM